MILTKIQRTIFSAFDPNLLSLDNYQKWLTIFGGQSNGSCACLRQYWTDWALRLPLSDWSLIICDSPVQILGLMSCSLFVYSSSRLLITFTNSLDPDQAQQNVGPDLDPNCMTLWWYSSKNFAKKLILEKISRRQKSMQIAHHAKSKKQVEGDLEGRSATHLKSPKTWA